MVQQALIDFLGKDITCLIAVFIGIWLMIISVFGIFAIIRFFNDMD